MICTVICTSLFPLFFYISQHKSRQQTRRSVCGLFVVFPRRARTQPTAWRVYGQTTASVGSSMSYENSILDQRPELTTKHTHTYNSLRKAAVLLSQVRPVSSAARLRPCPARGRRARHRLQLGRQDWSHAQLAQAHCSRAAAITPSPCSLQQCLTSAFTSPQPHTSRARGAICLPTRPPLPSP